MVLGFRLRSSVRAPRNQHERVSTPVRGGSAARDCHRWDATYCFCEIQESSIRKRSVPCFSLMKKESRILNGAFKQNDVRAAEHKRQYGKIVLDRGTSFFYLK